MKRNPRIAAVVDTATALADPLIVLRRALGGDDAAIDAVAHAWGARAPENNRQADAWYKAALVGWAASLRSPLTVRSYTRTIVAFWDWVARDRADRADGGTPEFLAPHDLNANDVARFVGALSGATTPTAWQCAALLGKRGGDPDTVELARAAVEVAHHEWAKQQGAVLKRDQLVELTVGQLKDENNTRLASIAEEWANNPGYIVEPQLARECQRFDWVLSKMVIGGYLYREPTYEQFVSMQGMTVGDHEELRKKDGKYPPYPYKEAVYRKPKAKEGTQPTTVAQRLACLASFWKRLLQEQMNTQRPSFLSFNPWPEHLRAFDRAGKDARPGRIAQRKTSIEDFRLLMGCLYDLGKSKAQPSVRSVLARRDMLAVLVMTVMGLRVSEMCALRRSSVREVVDTNGQLVRRMFVKRKGRGGHEEPVPAPESVLAAHDMMLHAMRDLLNKYSQDSANKELQVPPDIANRRHYYMAILKAYIGSREVPFVPAFARWGNAIQKTLMVVRKDEWDKAVDQDMRQWEGYEVAATGDETTQNTMYSVFVPWDADGVRKMLHDYVPRIAPGGQEKAMKMRLHPHGLRHLHAALAQRGVSFSIDRLQESLGHASPETTELYMDGPYAIERKQDAVEAAMAAMLGLRPRTPPRPAAPPAPAGEEGAAPPAPTRAPSEGGGAGGGIVPPAQTPAPRPKKEPKPRVGFESPIVPGSRTRRPTQTPEEAIAQKRAIEGKAGEKLRIAQDRARARTFPPGGDPIVPKDEIARILREEMVAVGLDPDAYAWGEKVTILPSPSPEELEAEDAFQRATFLAAQVAETLAVQPPPAEDPPVVAIVEADLPPVAPGTPPPAEAPPEPVAETPAEVPAAPTKTKKPTKAKAPKAKKPAAAAPPAAPPPPPPAKAIIAIGSLYRDEVHGPYFPPGDASFYAKPPLPLAKNTLSNWERDGWVPALRVVTQGDLRIQWLNAKMWTGARTLLPYLVLTSPGSAEKQMLSTFSPEKDGWQRLKPNARGAMAGERVAMPLVKLASDRWEEVTGGIKALHDQWVKTRPEAARALALWVGMMFTHALIAQHRVRGMAPPVWLDFDAAAPGMGEQGFDEYRSMVRGNYVREHDPAAIKGWLEQNADTWHGPLEGRANLSDLQHRMKAAGEATAAGFETVMDYLAIVRGEHPAAHGVGLQRYPVPGWFAADDPIEALSEAEKEEMRAWLRKTLPAWSGAIDVAFGMDAGEPLAFQVLLRPFLAGHSTLDAPDTEETKRTYVKFIHHHGVDPIVGARRTLRVLWELRKGMRGELSKPTAMVDAWGLVWGWIMPTRAQVEAHLAATVGDRWKADRERHIAAEFTRVEHLQMVMGLLPSIEGAIEQLMRVAASSGPDELGFGAIYEEAGKIAGNLWSPLLDQYATGNKSTRDGIVRALSHPSPEDTISAAAELATERAGMPLTSRTIAAGLKRSMSDYRPERWAVWKTWDDPKDKKSRESFLKTLGLPPEWATLSKAAAADRLSHARALMSCVRALIARSKAHLAKTGDAINLRRSKDEPLSPLVLLDESEAMEKLAILQAEAQDQARVSAGGSSVWGGAEYTPGGGSTEESDEGGEVSGAVGDTIKGLRAEKKATPPAKLTPDEAFIYDAMQSYYDMKGINPVKPSEKSKREARAFAEKALEDSKKPKRGKMKPNRAAGAAEIMPAGWSAVKGMRINWVRLWWLLTA